VQTGIVMVTRDRRDTVLRALAQVPEGVPVCLVDNGSQDGTAAAVRAAFPAVDVVVAARNLGAAGRTVGAQRLATPVVAFADDDSWWAPGALERAAARFAAEPDLGLLAARVLVGAEERLDPVCAALRDAPAVLGFVACGAVVRREAFLAVGGFDERYGVGGEEQRLALDLAAAGWRLAYDDAVVAHHHPAGGGRPDRPWRALRNDLWSAWLRRPLPAAVRRTVRLVRSAPPPVAARAVAHALRGVPWVLRERRVLPRRVEADLLRVEQGA